MDTLKEEPLNGLGLRIKFVRGDSLGTSRKEAGKAKEKKKNESERGGGRRWVESAFFLRSWLRKAATSSGSQLRTDLAPVVCTHTCDGACVRIHTCARAVCFQPASVLTWPRPSP